MLGRYCRLFSRREMRTHHYTKEQSGRHHSHQRRSIRIDRLQFREERFGIQGAYAQLDTSTHERVDSLCRNYQEHNFPLVSENIRHATSCCWDGHPHHTEHHGAQEYHHHAKVYQGGRCQQTGSQQENYPDKERLITILASICTGIV